MEWRHTVSEAKLESSEITRSHLVVQKTPKLFFGGWVRGESGKVTKVGDSYVSIASRKDLRNAVRIGGLSQPKWGSRDGYNKGQILYRFAEIVEGQKYSIINKIQEVTGSINEGSANTSQTLIEDKINKFIDRVVYWAGVPDKLNSLIGSVNTVAGSFTSTSTPEAGGVAVVYLEGNTVLEELDSYCDAVLPVLCNGNSVIVVTSPEFFLGLLALNEAWASSDLDKGTLCCLTTIGDYKSSFITNAASHSGVYAIDVSGLTEAEQSLSAEVAAASLMRIRFTGSGKSTLTRLAFYSEIKTTWNTISR